MALLPELQMPSLAFRLEMAAWGAGLCRISDLHMALQLNSDKDLSHRWTGKEVLRNKLEMGCQKA